MNLTTQVLLLTFLSLAAPLLGQTDATRQSEIGLMPLRWEWNSHELYSFNSVKTTAGIYYNQGLPRSGLEWTTSLFYASNNLFAACKTCSGLPIETGLLKEVSITSGIGYTFFQESKFFLKPYAQLEAHYTYENFSGLNEDIAIIPGPFPFDMRFHTAGTIVKAGVKLFLLEKVTLSCLSSFRWGVGTSRNAIIARQPRMALRFASSPVEVRIGLRF